MLKFKDLHSSILEEIESAKINGTLDQLMEQDILVTVDNTNENDSVECTSGSYIGWLASGGVLITAVKNEK